MRFNLESDSQLLWRSLFFLQNWIKFTGIVVPPEWIKLGKLKKVDKLWRFLLQTEMHHRFHVGSDKP